MLFAELHQLCHIYVIFLAHFLCGLGLGMYNVHNNVHLKKKIKISFSHNFLVKVVIRCIDLRYENSPKCLR